MQYNDEDLKCLQSTLLVMLQDIDRVCKKLQIEYFIDSGTVLGAKRHGGFIPWDDDIDIGMMRPEYERFISEAKDELPENYELCLPDSNLHGYAPMFVKIMRTDTKFYTQETIDAGFNQGVFIDVFPYDVISADENVANQQLKICQTSQRTSYLRCSPHVNVPHTGVLGVFEKTVCRVAHAVAKTVISPAKLFDRFNEWAQKGLEDPSDKYIVYAYPQGGIFPKDVLVPTSTLEFEGIEFPAPAQPERYLEIMYGDWRELPPVEKRRTHAPVELYCGE